MLMCQCSCTGKHRNMPIDHVMIKVGSWDEAKKYYGAAIKPLGYEVVADWGSGEHPSAVRSPSIHCEGGVFTATQSSGEGTL